MAAFREVDELRHGPRTAEALRIQILSYREPVGAGPGHHHTWAPPTHFAASPEKQTKFRERGLEERAQLGGLRRGAAERRVVRCRAHANSLSRVCFVPVVMVGVSKR